MKKLVLAEKPSVGRELAGVLGCANRGKYFESEEYVVTWALGHLVTLCPPDSYGEQYRRWSLRTLPMLPTTLNTMVIDKTQDQFDIVSGLLNREDIDEVVIATDAGREGELVARWILKQAECTKPIKRLWISSQTEAAIKQGFAELKDGHDYDRLYAAAESRSYADWYIGYNVSRAMSCHFDTRLSAGRVQTPTLALITQREDEIENFTGRFYWTIRATFESEKGSFTASRYNTENTVKIPTEDEAKAIEAKLSGKGSSSEGITATGRVTAVTSTPKSEKPPLAYDLTELQRDANRLLGYSAKETLDTLQRLYEVHKIVTYPRTDSRYITEDIVPTLGERLLALMDTKYSTQALRFARNGIREDLSRLVNNDMVSDHHALLPTEQKVDTSKLSEKERQLWELIICRFLETLSADYEYNTTTLEAEAAGEKFIARLTVPVSQGWRSASYHAAQDGNALNESAPENEDSSPALLTLKEGMELKVGAVETKRYATPAPQRYTEADLLYAMEHAGKLVEDAELRKRLENGLGTPATRADIIEKLIQNNCMERKGLELVPTPKGRELVRLVPPQLKSAELTGEWEKRLFAISGGTESEGAFIEDIKKNASDLVEQVKSSKELFNPDLMGHKDKPCPACRWPMMRVLDEYDRVHWVCQRFSCGYEEMEVKKRVMTPVVPSAASASPVKRVIASAKPSDGTAKKTLVIKKAAVKAVSSQSRSTWETVTEVVKPSHYRPHNERAHSSNTRPERERPERERPDRDRINRERPQQRESSGGTFADFIRASEERKKRDEEKRKKK